jgi:hypothetical protein
MTNPTNPFSWQMPTSTDLVTDLPADFEIFGQAVATSMADLLGGTTGQILAKASNTNMDFTWVTNDVGDITAVSAGTGLSGGGTSGAVTLSIDTATTADLTTAQTLTNKTLTSPALTTPTISTLTTNGDLLYGTGSGALARRAIGTTGQVLTVSGGVPTWATAGGGGKVLQVVSATYSTATAVTGTTYGDTGLSLAITPTLSTSKILVMVNQTFRTSIASSVGVGGGLRILRDASAIYTPSPGGYEIHFWESPTSGGREAYDIKSLVYLDSPATTSSTTYKTQMRGENGSVTATAQSASAVSVITLLEIGA